MKVVVTGGSGALGRQVIAELAAAGHQALNLDRVAHPQGFKPTWVADLRSEGSLYQALVGAQAVIHLAAHVAPGLVPDTATFNDNVSMTYNVFKAASDLGVRRVVFASSIGAYGYLYGPVGVTPDYLPMDEAHRCVPVDPYGLSKVAGEAIADSFCRKGNMSAASLRLAGVNYDPTFERIRGFMADPGFRQRGFWSYVDVRDAARGCILALEADSEGHERFNMAAAGSNMREGTPQLIERFFPALKEIRNASGANWSGIDSSKAARVLGFRANHVWDKGGGS
jgi:nucleoside-diphosphate-sugar epimerase